MNYASKNGANGYICCRQYILENMTERKIDVVKQPITALFATFGVLLVVFTIRALTATRGAEVLPASSLSPLAALIDSLGRTAPALAVTVSLLLTLTGAVMVTSLISRYSVSVVRSFIPMVIFIIGAAGMVFPLRNPSIPLVIVMVIRSMQLFILGFKRTERFDEVMRAGFYMGLAALLWPHMTIYALCFPVLCVLYKRSLRERVAGYMMMLLPFLLISFGWWISGADFGFVIRSYFDSFASWRLTDFAAAYSGIGGLSKAVLFGYMTLLALVSIAVFLSKSGEMRLRARKIHHNALIMYAAACAVFVSGAPEALSVPFMTVASIPLTHTFFVKRQGMTTCMIYVIMVLIALVSAFI